MYTRHQLVVFFLAYLEIPGTSVQRDEFDISSMILDKEVNEKRHRQTHVVSSYLRGHTGTWNLEGGPPNF